MLLKRATAWLLALIMIAGQILNPDFVRRTEAAEVNAKETVQEGNIQTYYDEDGNPHTIYWAKGINPPKMTSDPEKQGKGEYFEKDVAGTYITYQAPLETGKGYYDLNKNMAHPEEKNLCYLAAATNMLYWWMDQNSAYIDEYLDRLSKGEVYGQTEGLVKILPYDKEKWERMRKAPELSYVEGFGKEQELGKSRLAKEALGVYFLREDGYYQDAVIDFFMNGYPAEDPMMEPNREEDYVKDKRGGYFYPIFENKRLTERYRNREERQFRFYNDNLKEYLNNGQMVSISYQIGSILAHAITLWGAEYDENGRLCRIFVTDSDDYGSTTLADPGTVRGMHSMGIKEGKTGAAYLSNNTDPNAGEGSYVQGIATLDLAQDEWEARLADDKDPVSPEITGQPEDAAYAKGATAKPLAVEIKAGDTGKFTYQWYVSDQDQGEGKKLEKATKNEYRPDTNTLGEAYYYCEITNHKNGKETKIKTRYAKIESRDIPLIHAATPKVSFNSYKVTYPQYSTPEPLRVSASVSDQGTLSYQWYIASDSASTGTPIRGETGNTFTPPTSQIGRSFYYCVVTNTNESEEITGDHVVSVKTYGKAVIIEEAALVDAQPPVLKNELSGAEYVEKDPTAPLSVSAKSIDGGSLSYQWYRADGKESQGEKIEGAAESSYTPSSEVPGTVYYYCVVTNTNENASGKKEASVSTERAEIRVKKLVSAEKPVITKEPDSAEYIENEKTQALTVKAEVKDGGSLSYQWYRADGKESQGEKIEGAAESSYTPSSRVPGTAYYYCVVTNTNKNATGKKEASVSTERAEIRVKKLVSAEKPVITKGPDSAEYIENEKTQALTVKAEVKDGGSLSYQWYRADGKESQGEKIEGAAESSYTPSSRVPGTAYYYCVVTNTNKDATGNKTASIVTDRAQIIVKEKEPEPQPEEKPEVPEEKPETPETRPEVPEEKPETPETRPEVPEEKPGTPEIRPEVPEEKPGTPGKDTKLSVSFEAGKKSIRLEWKKISGAEGYDIFIYDTKNKKYRKIKTLSATKTSYPVKRLNGSRGKKLKAGKTYRFTVRAYETVQGKKLYKKTETIQAATKTAKVKIDRLRQTAAGRFKITWKKQKDVNGYQILLSDSKKGKYKSAGMTKGGKKISYVKKGLKKKTYFVRVRSYRIVDGKKVYGVLSDQKKIRMR